jgi:hypothetical protein
MNIRDVIIVLTAADERLDLFDAFVKFADTTNMDYESILANIYYRNNHLAHHDLLNLIFNECSKALLFALENAGIVTSPQCVLRDLLNVNNAIIDSMQYEDKRTIADILENDESDLDKLCSIFSLVTVADESYYSGILESVTPTTITLYKSICQNSEGVASDEQIKNIRDRVDKYRYYKSKINNEKLLSDIALDNTGGVCQPIELYVRALAQRADFYEQHTEIFVKDFYGFSLLSLEGEADFLNTLEKTAKTLYFSPDAQTKVAVYARNFIGVVA